jgi:hypothetical protein
MGDYWTPDCKWVPFNGRRWYVATKRQIIVINSVIILIMSLFIYVGIINIPNAQEAYYLYKNGWEVTGYVLKYNSIERESRLTINHTFEYIDEAGRKYQTEKRYAAGGGLTRHEYDEAIRKAREYIGDSVRLIIDDHGNCELASDKKSSLISNHVVVIGHIGIPSIAIIICSRSIIRQFLKKKKQKDEHIEEVKTT